MALALSGCGLPGGDTTPAAGPPSSPRVIVSPTPSANVAGGSYWVLSPVGLRLHQSADPSSPTITIIRPGAELVAAERRPGNTPGQSFLHVHAANDPTLDGWVLDDPALLTATAVVPFSDPQHGFSVLVPKNWTQAPAPDGATLADPSGRPRLRVLFAATVADFKFPTSPGKADHDEGPVDVFGKSPVITWYRLDAGGFEGDLAFDAGNGRAIGLSYSAADSNSTLLKQVLASAGFS